MPKLAQKLPALPLDERNALADKSLPECLDALNAAINEAESHLRALKPIEPVWITYDSVENGCGDGTNYYVGFAKFEGKWRILWSYWEVGSDPENGSDALLTSRPIEDRLAAAEFIPKLHEKIVANKEEIIEKVNKAISTLKSMTKHA